MGALRRHGAVGWGLGVEGAQQRKTQQPEGPWEQKWVQSPPPASPPPQGPPERPPRVRDTGKGLLHSRNPKQAPSLLSSKGDPQR